MFLMMTKITKTTTTTKAKTVKTPRPANPLKVRSQVQAGWRLSQAEIDRIVSGAGYKPYGSGN
jgi:hypothetical protein